MNGRSIDYLKQIILDIDGNKHLLSDPISALVGIAIYNYAITIPGFAKDNDQSRAFIQSIKENLLDGNVSRTLSLTGVFHLFELMKKGQAPCHEKIYGLNARDVNRMINSYAALIRKKKNELSSLSSQQQSNKIKKEEKNAKPNGSAANLANEMKATTPENARPDLSLFPQKQYESLADYCTDNNLVYSKTVFDLKERWKKSYNPDWFNEYKITLADYVEAMNYKFIKADVTHFDPTRYKK